MNELTFHPRPNMETWAIYRKKNGICLGDNNKWFKIKLKWRDKEEITILEYK